VSLKYMRVLLGNSVRVGIDVNDRGACEVRARWKCGCAAVGSNFSGLRATMCDEHHELHSRSAEVR